MHKVKKAKAPVKKTAGKAQSGNITINPPAKPVQWPLPEKGKQVVLAILNAGTKLPASFDRNLWQEISISPIPGEGQFMLDIRQLAVIPTASCDVIWNAGSLCYLYAHEVPGVIAQFGRILKNGGRLSLTLPDMQRVGQMLAQGKIEKGLYQSPAGPITPLDIIYGHRAGLQNGRRDIAVHTGFTAGSIAQKLPPAGFGHVEVRRDGWMLTVMAQKVPCVPADKPHMRVIEEDMNNMMKRRDTIDQAPEILKITLPAGAPSPLK